MLFALLALTVSSWATQVTWGSTELSTLNLSVGNTESQEFDGIIVSLRYQNGYDNCYFNNAQSYPSFSLNNSGTLIFAPELGKLTRIVIARTYDETSLPFVEGSGWELDSENPKLLVWTGEAASSVELKSNSSVDLFSGPISSIVFTISGTIITWEGNDLESVNVGMDNGAIIENANSSQEVNGITITANAPAGSNSSNFSTWVDVDDSSIHGTDLMLGGEGSLTFAPASGKLTKIVITCGTASDGDNINDGDGWSWNGTDKLTWEGNAASVVLTPKDPSYGCGFRDISSVKFAVTPDEVTPPSDPSGPSFIWTTQQVNLVDLSCTNEYRNSENSLINNIFTSLEQTEDKYEDYNDYENLEYCEFSHGQIKISNKCGTLKFKSIIGDLTGIVITCSYIESATELSDNWRYDNEANTLTWVGTQAEEVTLSGNLNISVSSIKYFYDPADAPRVSEEFYDSWQWYEITGAHTAKVTGPRNLGGSINIPASVEDNGVTYYINEINEYAFYNRGELSNASIGENVAIIGAHAFDGCSQITEITIYSRVVESIGDEAFKNCLLLHGMQCYNTIPPVLGSNAFEGDTRLNHIDVYSWVVNTYKGTTNWSDYSSKITALWSDRAIGEKFFYHNQKTTGVYEVTSASPKEAKVLPYPADVNAIYPISYESTLVIPESPDYMHYGYSLTTIAANAFKDITDFKAVSIPKSVKSIEEGAFSGCTSVENVFFLWDDPRGIVTWADANVGDEFKTAASGNTKIFVPAGTLAAYKEWAPAWESCMYESAFEDVTASDDPHDVVYYRTYYDSSHDLMLPPDVWAYVGYVNGDEFILRPIAFDGEIVPAGTAVVLRSFSQTYRLIMMAPEAPAYTGTNQLRGTDTQIVIASDPVLSAKAGQIYVLGREGWVNSQRQEGMGLYRYTGTTLGAHKAYMILNSSPNNAPARFLFKHEQTATGIENASANFGESEKRLENGQLIIIKNGVRYNAQGQIVK